MAAQYGLNVSQERMDQGVSPNQVASILGITRETVMYWIHCQRLPAVKQAGGYWKVSKSDLERFLRDRIGGPRRRVFAAGLDDESVGLLREVASTMGLDVVGANGAFDALLKIQQHWPALCVVDCSSPEYGWGFVKRVRSSKFNKGCPVMVVARTAFEQAEFDRALALKVQACLVEPLSTDSLKSDIERLLNRGA
jgi:excisionase family DNA binding protein